jgi:hypothetical protein
LDGEFENVASPIFRSNGIETVREIAMHKMLGEQAGGVNENAVDEGRKVALSLGKCPRA